MRHCHERFDGTGYPDRKRAEEIPIESRIILVCDAYHAMTTDRPYRKRLPREEALRRLDEAQERSSTPTWSRSASAFSQRASSRTAAARP